MAPKPAETLGKFELFSRNNYEDPQVSEAGHSFPRCLTYKKGAPSETSRRGRRSPPRLKALNRRATHRPLVTLRGWDWIYGS